MRVGIVGSGLAGKACARALVALCPQVSVELIDDGASHTPSGVTALFGGGQEVLRRVGLWDAIRPHVTPCVQHEVLRVRGGQLTTVSLSGDVTGEDGGPVLGLVRTQTLYDLLDGSTRDVPRHEGRVENVRVREHGATCQMKSGDHFYDVVVACDGRTSFLRKLLHVPFFEGYTGVVGASAVWEYPTLTEGGGGSEARTTQWLGRDGWAVESCGPVVSGGWTTHSATIWRQVTAPYDDKLQPVNLSSVSTFLADTLGKDHPVVETVGRANVGWMWGVNRATPLITWSHASGRMVLMGDAAHPYSLGQWEGGDDALMDAYCYASHLANQGEDPQKLHDVAQGYEAARKGATTATMGTKGPHLLTRRGILGAVRDVSIRYRAKRRLLRALQDRAELRV